MRGLDPRIHLKKEEPIQEDGLHRNSGLPEFRTKHAASRVDPTCGVKPGNDDVDRS
jgi:hypothetical protein